MRRMPLSAPRLLTSTLRTGGLNPFDAEGMDSSHSVVCVVRDRPVMGHRFPGSGSRMNSGLVGFFESDVTLAVMSDILSGQRQKKCTLPSPFFIRFLGPFFRLSPP